MGLYRIAQTEPEHIPGVVALQRACFPEPFPEDLLWQPKHIESHIKIFPEGQWVALFRSMVVASCTNALVLRVDWDAHLPLDEMIGGLSMPDHNPKGRILYGIDISVHPDHRRQGLGRLLYAERFDYVTKNDIYGYGTVCRLPGFQESGLTTPDAYAAAVNSGEITDRTLTPLTKMGLTYKGIIENYIEDEESGNAGAILEWTP